MTRRKNARPREGDVVTPGGDRRSAGVSKERSGEASSRARRDPRPGMGEREGDTPRRPEDLETHEEAEARRASGGAPYEKETQPTEEDLLEDPGS